MTKQVYSHVKKKIKNHRIWLITHLPLLLAIFALFFIPENAKTILKYSGYTALLFLVSVLILTPLIRIFPTVVILKNINKHRRELGVAAFSYAMLHMISYVIKKGSIFKAWQFAFHPAIIPAFFIALPILLLLSLTSNNFSIKKLGFNKWKNLHKKVYIAEIAIFLHMIMVGEAFYAFLIFIPLFFIQYKSQKKS